MLPGLSFLPRASKRISAGPSSSAGAASSLRTVSSRLSIGPAGHARIWKYIYSQSGKLSTFKFCFKEFMRRIEGLQRTRYPKQWVMEDISSMNLLENVHLNLKNSTINLISEMNCEHKRWCSKPILFSTWCFDTTPTCLSWSHQPQSTASTHRDLHCTMHAMFVVWMKSANKQVYWPWWFNHWIFHSL